jgi:hypothetical protein
VLPALVLAAAAATVCVCASAELANSIDAKPGGKVKVSYGKPRWREAFAAEIKPGLIWRMGSNLATTLETEGGLLFDDAVIFPGSYNLSMQLVSDTEWNLAFHQYGPFWPGTDADAMARCEHSTVDAKKVADCVELGFAKTKAGAGHMFQVAFGPHVAQARFSGVKARTIKGKIKTTSCELTYLERDDLEALAKKLESAGVPVARATAKKGELIQELELKTGATPTLTFTNRVSGKKRTRYPIGGQTRDAKVPGKALTAAFEAASDGSVLVFGVGTKEYVFPLNEDAMARE